MTRAGRPGERRNSPSGAVQSVDRAVSVLEILARRGEAGVTEIADELGVHRSTAFRLLGVLENRGLVGQAGDRGKYHLGAGVLRLAGAAAVRLDVSQEAVPVCRDLADELGETVNAAVPDEDAAVNIMQARGTAAAAATVVPGGVERAQMLRSTSRSSASSSSALAALSARSASAVKSSSEPCIHTAKCAER